MIFSFITFNKFFYEMPNDILIFLQKIVKMNLSVRRESRWKIGVDVRMKDVFSSPSILSPYTKGQFVV